MSWDYDYYRYTPAPPREVKGGIKAHSRRGDFSSKWWAKRWIDVLESFNIGARLARGRSYARRGQVISIDIQEGNITAKVQGTRKTPYKISISVKTLKKKEWQEVARLLSGQVLFAAKLMNGEMPEEIEEVFFQAGFSLFPSKQKDLTTNCSCPDWSNPCKHIAAVYYIIGEEFDRDPFLIFKLRGIERAGLMELMGMGAKKIEESKVETKGKRVKKKGKAAETQSSPEPSKKEKKPLCVDPRRFWTGQVLKETETGNIEDSSAEEKSNDGASEITEKSGTAKKKGKAAGDKKAKKPTGNKESAKETPSAPILPESEGFENELEIPKLSAGLPKQLGNFPFWRGNDHFLDTLETVYGKASRFGKQLSVRS